MNLIKSQSSTAKLWAAYLAAAFCRASQAPRLLAGSQGAPWPFLVYILVQSDWKACQHALFQDKESSAKKLLSELDSQREMIMGRNISTGFGQSKQSKALEENDAGRPA